MSHIAQYVEERTTTLALKGSPTVLTALFVSSVSQNRMMRCTRTCSIGWVEWLIPLTFFLRYIKQTLPTLKKPTLLAVARKCILEQIGAGPVYAVGDACSAVYFLLEGSVTLTAAAPGPGPSSQAAEPVRLVMPSLGRAAIEGLPTFGDDALLLDAATMTRADACECADDGCVVISLRAFDWRKYVSRPCRAKTEMCSFSSPPAVYPISLVHRHMLTFN